jgi:hypothetical protein
MANHNDNHVSTDDNDTELPEDIKPTYNVLTADVSETYYPPIEDSSKSNSFAAFIQYLIKVALSSKFLFS